MKFYRDKQYVCFFKLSRRQNSVTFSRAGTRVKVWRFLDASGTDSVPIFRVCWWFGRTKTDDHQRTQNMGTDSVPEVSENLHTLTRHSARENLIGYIFLISVWVFNLRKEISSSSSSAVQPWVGLGLLKHLSPAISILGIRQPISTTQFPCVFLYLVSPSWFRLATSSLTSTVCPLYPFR